MSCEGCSVKFTLLRRKKKCKDCDLIFCSECSNSKGKFYQCYRCKVLTTSPLNFTDVENLKLRDLQWFLEKKGVNVPSTDMREKPALVDWVMKYSRGQHEPVRTCPTPVSLFRFNEAPESQGNPADTNPLHSSQNSSNTKISLVNKDKHTLIDLSSVSSRDQILNLSPMEMKLLLTRNYISFRGCCEKGELQEKVFWLWDVHEAASCKNIITDENLCKICMAENIDSLFLDCGHMVTCTNCGKLLHDCPICRQVIARVVRAFKS